MRPKPPIALTIAGSDCSGGAGLEADLKTFAAHRVYGMAAVTAVVAENPKQVVSITPVPPEAVKQQIDCCLTGMSSVAVKVGMLFSSAIIQACDRELTKFCSCISHVVVDPVMVSTSGKALLASKAIRTLEKFLLHHADLVTPNLDEAQVWIRSPIRTRSQIETAARQISKRFQCAVLLKGGHLHGSRWADDYLWDGKKGWWVRALRVSGIKTHGTGCTYASSIAANLAWGHPLSEAVRRSKRFVTRTIQESHRFKPWMALNHLARS